MNADSSPCLQDILAHLDQLNRLRAKQSADAQLALLVQALKAFQQQRFRSCYPDFFVKHRDEKATRFFLDELSGPGDFSGRDAQFARIVPTLVRLFPNSVVSAVVLLCDLHALSEYLDDAMARASSRLVVTMSDYLQLGAHSSSPKRDAVNWEWCLILATNWTA